MEQFQLIKHLDNIKSTIYELRKQLDYEENRHGHINNLLFSFLRSGYECLLIQKLHKSKNEVETNILRMKEIQMHEMIDCVIGFS